MRPFSRRSRREHLCASWPIPSVQGPFVYPTSQRPAVPLMGYVVWFASERTDASAGAQALESGSSDGHERQPKRPAVQSLEELSLPEGVLMPVLTE